jgi:hypothetical protein
MLAGLRSQRPLRPRPDAIGKSCRAAPWRLAYEQVVTKDEPHPPAELVTIAGRAPDVP